MIPNYDRDSLHLEVDHRGWILGESALGAAILGDTGGAWDDVLGDFTSIDLASSVQVDQGAFFRPEAATLSVQTKTLTRLDDLYNKQVRLRYANTDDAGVLFMGLVKSADISAAPDYEHPAEVQYRLSITATGASSALNRVLFHEFTAPQETVTDRIARIYPAAVASDLPSRQMPACGPLDADVLSLLQECSDVAAALFIVDEFNRVQIARGHFPYRGASALTYTFDESNVTGLRLTQNIDNIVTRYVVAAKSDPSVTAVVQASGAVIANQQAITVDTLATSGDVESVARSLPRSAFVPVAPASITPKADYRGLSELDRPRLLDTATLTLDGATYTGAVVGVSDSITPDLWSPTLTLAPSSVLDREDTPDAPGPVTALSTTARTASTVALKWKAPQAVGSATGYVVRRASGTVAPASPTAGTGVGGVLPITTLTLTDTGLSSMTDYAYAVFVVTADPAIHSPATTHATWTTPALPTPVITLTTSGFNAYDVAWTASTLDTASWEVTGSYGGHQVGLSPTLAPSVRSFASMYGPSGVNTARVTATRVFHGITYTATATKNITQP